MAETLGAVASVLTVLKLAGAATKYVKDVKQGSSDRLRLRDELRSTTCLLEMLKDRIEDSEDAAGSDAESDALTLKPSSIASLAGDDSPLALFQQILEDIISKLAPQDRLRRLTQPFKWPFDKKDIAELVSTLERLKTHFTLIMQNDLVELAKLSHAKLDNIRQAVENARSKSLGNEAQKIILWISPVSHRPRHLDVLENAQTGTGSWFLNHPTFKRWVDGEVDVLWCPGIPGAGKTILASLAIDKLERDSNSARAICTYVYCHYNTRAEQTPVVLLSSLLQQVLQHSVTGTLPTEVLSLYELHNKYGTRPTLDQVTNTLGVLAAKFTTFRVVIDALDECAESHDDALRFISAIRSLGPSVKLFCTSRFSTVFENYFSAANKLEISARSEDIRMFVDYQTQQLSGFARHVRVDPSLKDEIIDAIIGESHGMFLLAKLHLDSLSRKMNRKAVRAALKTLPTTLDATYSNAVQRIYNQGPDAVAVAEHILFWVVCAKRPLSVLELRHVYATFELSEGTPLEDDDLPDGEILTSTCGELILVDAESQTVRLVHYTAQEYFERSHTQALAAARLSLSNISLAYLTLPNFSDGPCAADAAMARRLEQYPFLDYASKCWGEGISRLSTAETEGLWPRLVSFVSDRAAVDVASQVQNLPRVRYSRWSQEYPRNVPPLVLAAGFDMPQILRRLITAKGQDIESKGSDGVTAIIRAAACGLADNVRVLLQQGANLEALDYLEETPLHKAARKGAEGAVEALMDAGADVNARSPDWTTLMSAVFGGNVEVVKMLVGAGADLTAETLWGETALTIALKNGQETIAMFLAGHGAVLPRNSAARRASTIASRNGNHHLARRLAGDYEIIAARPLERQVSTVIGGLAGIQEEAEAADTSPSDTSNNPQPEPPGSDEGNVIETLEDLSYQVGFKKRYDICRLIGKGRYGTVHDCHDRVTGVWTAVKIYVVDKWEGSDPKLRSLRHEVAILRKLRDSEEEPHPSILKMILVFADYRRRRLFMLTERADDGTLFDVIIKKGMLSDQQTGTVFAQLLSALEFLHDRGWVHRDIKPENILMADQESLTIKLADFGYAEQLPAGSGPWYYGAALMGTPTYVPPETLEVDQRIRKCGPASDMWSCGVVLYVCLCGFPPFSDDLESEEFPYNMTQQIMGAIFDFPSPWWDSVSDAAMDLIEGMLTLDMVKRFSARQCLEHPWMVAAASRVFDLDGDFRLESPSIRGPFQDDGEI